MAELGVNTLIGSSYFKQEDRRPETLSSMGSIRLQGGKTRAKEKRKKGGREGGVPLEKQRYLFYGSDKHDYGGRQGREEKQNT